MRGGGLNHTPFPQRSLPPESGDTLLPLSKRNVAAVDKL